MENDVLEYSRMIVPSTMRSQYWKYFGFPSDSFNNIITRKKIICTLCSTAIAYNKNTTNLRTHLVAKHPDILIKLNLERREKRVLVPDSVPIKRQKISEKSEERATEPDEIQIKLSSVNSIIEAFSNDPDIVEKSNDGNDFQDYTSNLQSDYEIEEIDASSLKPDANFTDVLQDMLIKDLLSPAFIEGPGFRNLTWTLSGNSSSPTRSEMDTNLNKTYQEKFAMISEKIKTHSLKEHFSLGIETWQNVERKTLISIYYNYVSQEPESTLNNILFKTLELSMCSNMAEVFEGFNLQNCTGAIMNVENGVINNFLSDMQIPISLCFEATISRCLQATFAISSMISLFREIEDFLVKNELLCEASAVPEMLEGYPWTKYNFLKYFYDNVSWTDDSNELLIKAKGVIDCLTPLKVTLETLSDEQLTLNSLVRPLTTKLMEQYFCSYECDIEIVLEVKEAINQELTKSVLANEFFIESAFMDPRFQSFIDCDGIQAVKNNLNNKLTRTECPDIKAPKLENHGTTRKSSLTLFFNKSEQKAPKFSGRNSLELEITKYISEVSADLEQCPQVWWNEVGYIYRTLRKFSEKYICVPCCVNYLFKKSIDEQVEFSNRRFMLRGKYVCPLWFLHYNKDC